MNIHQKYMSRAIEIAGNGLGSTAPNPMVGAVIVHNGKIIGEGYTSAYGGPHAEVNAIASVADISLLKTSTLYVTLEPCSHYGKTPPCADLIIEQGIPLVVVGLIDPHDKVAGKGIVKLREAGVEVHTGMMEAECREHHKRFLTFHGKRRPYVVLKWAETADGFIAPEIEQRKDKPEPVWISGKLSRQLVHKWRSEEQAILVGTNTVLQDNPKLDVRDWTGRNPIRVVPDRGLRIQGDFHVLDGSVRTFILTEVADTSRYDDGPEYHRVDGSDNSDGSGNMATEILQSLYQHSVMSVLVEGGAKTLQSFIDADLWDEARIFQGATSFKKGCQAPELSGKLVSSQTVGPDILRIFRRPKA